MVFSFPSRSACAMIGSIKNAISLEITEPTMLCSVTGSSKRLVACLAKTWVTDFRKRLCRLRNRRDACSRCKLGHWQHIDRTALTRVYGLGGKLEPCCVLLHTCSIDRLAGKKRYLSSDGVGFSCRCWISSGRSSIRCPSRGLPKPSQSLRSSDARKAGNRIGAQPDHPVQMVQMGRIVQRSPPSQTS